MTNPAYRAYRAGRVAHKKLRGVSITVSRGLNSSAPFVATVGFSGSTTFDGDGSTLYTKNRDYIIDVALYNIGGAAVEPVKYDTITELVNGVLRTYQVVESQGNGVSETSDADMTTWRVHTTEI
jgi:hypothetical protein